ncbi:MAG TPA: elongation factor G, partial [Firmicutes bacterium]|nr:elongation factor G [Bacillota bacterium]
EVLKELVKTRYDVFIDFGPCEIIYLESIKEPVIGRGHYEPLKHYAEVHLRLEPAPRGAGITFASQMHVDQLAESYQNLIRSHVLERCHKGILTGSPLSDVHITLVAGAAHELHTSGGDFLEATCRAIRQGLEKADNVLLEPYYEFEIEVCLNLLGRVLHDVQLAHGQFLPPKTTDCKAVIKGMVPVVNFMNYGVELMSFTKGEGRLTLQVKGYDVCHNPTEVIKKYNYDKFADRLNPSASIFCAKGSGFVVPWDEADAFMHC